MKAVALTRYLPIDDPQSTGCGLTYACADGERLVSVSQGRCRQSSRHQDSRPPN
jgi:hypothetical protein